MQLSPREAAGGAERRVCSPWAPSSLGAGFLPPELPFNRAGPARRRLLRIQLHHFYLGADPRPLLQFLGWMGLHLQGHCWGVRSITVTSGSNCSSKQWSVISVSHRMPQSVKREI